MRSSRRREPRRAGPPRANLGEGFTLVELVLALALIGGSFLTLLFLRTEAVDRAHCYTHERELRRLAQEQLDEVAFSIVDDTEGTFEDRDHADWQWTVETVQVSTTGPVLLECTISVEHTIHCSTDKQIPNPFTLTTWFFPDDEHPLLDSIDTGELEGF